MEKKLNLNFVQDAMQIMIKFEYGGGVMTTPVHNIIKERVMLTVKVNMAGYI